MFPILLLIVDFKGKCWSYSVVCSRRIAFVIPMHPQCSANSIFNFTFRSSHVLRLCFENFPTSDIRECTVSCPLNVGFILYSIGKNGMFNGNWVWFLVCDEIIHWLWFNRAWDMWGKNRKNHREYVDDNEQFRCEQLVKNCDFLIHYSSENKSTRQKVIKLTFLLSEQSLEERVCLEVLSATARFAVKSPRYKVNSCTCPPPQRSNLDRE